jgi:uncharacterized membrane protein YhaH (DUF805 family)
MTFGESVETCFDFNGRASRSEYWWFFLFCALVYLGAVVVDATADSSVWFVLAILALFFPITAAAVRRLHDTARSGWWWFLTLNP